VRELEEALSSTQSFTLQQLEERGFSRDLLSQIVLIDTHVPELCAQAFKLASLIEHNVVKQIDDYGRLITREDSGCE
jgi:hypothetical protein